MKTHEAEGHAMAIMIAALCRRASNRPSRSGDPSHRYPLEAWAGPTTVQRLGYYDDCRLLACFSSFTPFCNTFLIKFITYKRN